MVATTTGATVQRIMEDTPVKVHNYLVQCMDMLYTRKCTTGILFTYNQLGRYSIDNVSNNYNDYVQGTPALSRDHARLIKL